MKGYEKLETVFREALKQAASGKGKERHAIEGQPFENQVSCFIAREVGLGYPLGQAAKKILESKRLSKDKAIAELLGVINYLGMAIILLQEED